MPTLPAAVAQTRQPGHMRALGMDLKLVVARIPAEMLVAALTWSATHPPAEHHNYTSGRKDLDRVGMALSR